VTYPRRELVISRYGDGFYVRMYTLLDPFGRTAGPTYLSERLDGIDAAMYAIAFEAVEPEGRVHNYAGLEL